MDNAQDWQEKLVGKRFVDDNEAVPAGIDPSRVVRRSDLPKHHRIVKPGTMSTTDFRPERLNVKLDEENRVTSANFG
jgi:predicted pyridoxine 5'-phosphate oxidase superfamily flavin-nucleotide-binding protein